MMIIVSAWILISVFGFAFAFLDALRSYNHYVLVQQGWPERQRLLEYTKMGLISQGARAVLMLVFLAVGLNSLFGGNRWAFISLMFTANILVVGASIRSYFYRRKMFNMREEDEGPPEGQEERRAPTSHEWPE